MKTVQHTRMIRYESRVLFLFSVVLTSQDLGREGERERERELPRFATRDEKIYLSIKASRDAREHVEPRERH